MLNYGDEQYYPKWVGNCGKTRMLIRWSNAKHAIKLIRELLLMLEDVQGHITASHQRLVNETTQIVHKQNWNLTILVL